MKSPRRRSAGVIACAGVAALGLWAPGLLAASAASAPEPTMAYTVVKGDTLIGVRDRLLVPSAPWVVLQRINRVPDPRRLQPGSTLQLPLSLLREKDVNAAVVTVHGQVLVQRRGASTPLTLSNGESLLAGDLVITGAQSSAGLSFEDGAQLLLRPDSRLLIERLTRVPPLGPTRTELQLEAGSADTRVPVPASGAARSRLQMRTPVVNLGVRGTEFRTLAAGERAQTEVLQGRVAAARPAGAGPGVVVDAGFGVVATARGVGLPRALLPAPDLAGAPALIERLPLRLPWQPLAGATGYRAQVFSTEGSVLRLEGLFPTPQAQWADDLPDGQYELRVRAADAEGLEGRDAAWPFRLKARPEPPFITEPRAGTQVTSESVRFQWTRSAASTRYALQVSDSPSFEPLRLNRADLTQTEVDLLLPIGTHHWRVASVRGDDDRGPWSDAQTVTRVPPPPPIPPAPPAAALPQTTSDGLLLVWPRVPAAGARYALQVSRDAGFQTLLADEITDQPQWLLRSPEPGLYFVRVRTVAPDGLKGPFGATQQLDVPRSALWWLLVPAVLLLLL